MKAAHGIAIGCGILGLLALAGTAALVFWFAYVSEDVTGVNVEVESPPSVTVGETFELTVTVTNERSDHDLKLSDVDIAERYLEGFIVTRTTPKPKSTMHVPIDNSRSFTFGVSIPPGETRDFTFVLQAQKPGLFRGDVDVCEGIRFITVMAQTSVEEPAEAP